jgi:site-specific recombinase XerD
MIMRERYTKDGCLKAEKEGFWEYLLEKGYSPASFKNYKWVLMQLEHYMLKRGTSTYSRRIGKVFLEYAKSEKAHTTGVLIVFALAIRRFETYLYSDAYRFRMPTCDRTCPPQFKTVFEQYLENLAIRGLKPGSIDIHRCNTLKALDILNGLGVTDLAAITPGHIYEMFERAMNKRNHSSSMRDFLRYLYSERILETDFSVLVPSVRGRLPIPSVYTKSETETFLHGFNTKTPAGLRNRAITLLALRLGMRSGDIVNLKLSDVDYQTKTISFVQEKTNVPQRLELLPEVEYGIREYLERGRRDSGLPNLFISLRPPIRPMTSGAICSLTREHFQKVGIDSGERARGAHSFRSTLASELVSERFPYDVVRRVLGHEDPTAIKHYVKFDIGELRASALDVPAVSGRLSEYIESRLEAD